MEAYSVIVALRKLESDEGFIRILSVYDRELERMKDRLFNANTPAAEAAELRIAIIECERLHPRRLLGDTTRSLQSVAEKESKTLGYPPK